MRACGLLRDRGVRFRCLIYGDGEQREALEDSGALVGTRRHGRACPVRSCRTIWSRSTGKRPLFALPCQVLDNGDRDGLPNVLVEAMAMEIPVVSTNVSGVPELVEDGHNGFLVPPRSPDALADRMQTSPQDPTCGASSRPRAVARVLGEFSLEATRAACWQLFQCRPGTTPDGDHRIGTRIAAPSRPQDGAH